MKPRVGRKKRGQPWGRGAGVLSTLKGLCEDATLSG
jgi:hypothetical protein